jgi:lysophospholipase L1-like esterase
MWWRTSCAASAAVCLSLLAASGTSGSAPETVLVVGDSLATGLQPYLGPLVEPRAIVWDVSAGRTTPEGLVRLRAELRDVTPGAVLVSLGTNDGPHADRFRDRIRRALRAIPAGVCVVWADIDRPARKGPYRPLNAELAKAARRDPRLTVVHWHRAVASHKVDLPDYIHPDADGFRYRSRLYASALERGCG